MKRISLFLAVSMLIFACNPKNKDKTKEEDYSRKDTVQTLKNAKATLKVSLYGGAYVNFQLNDQKLNPLTWKLTNEQMPQNNKDGAIFQGHFLCFGRWGGPTQGEIKAGIPHNGEPTNNWWRLNNSSENAIEMQAWAKAEQMEIIRQINLEPQKTVYNVTEEIKNPNSFGRYFNIVQHATLGTPFLSENTIVDCNATYGFSQDLAKPDLYQYEYVWPNGYIKDPQKNIDLRRSHHKEGFVTTHVFSKNSEYGWITATSPENNLLIGYIWKTADYPWLHVWHGLLDGKLWAKGIEFGTTGLGDTFAPDDRIARVFHGQKNFIFIDAKSQIKLAFSSFLAKVPDNFKHVQNIQKVNGKIIISILTKDDLIEKIEI